VAHKFTGTVEIGEVVFDIRYVSQKQLETINEQSQKRAASGIGTETDVRKSRDLTCDARIAGWSKLTREDALGWGMAESWEDLPVDADDFVVYSPETARKLYRECSYTAFRQVIDEACDAIVKAVALEKKAARTRSAESLKSSE